MNNTQNYVLRKHKLRGEWHFDIEQEGLIYSDCAPTHHGLQCNHVGGTDEHKEIMSLCDQVVELVKKIDALNTKPVVSASTGGTDKYFADLEKWENSFYCNECGCDKITDFYYSRTVSNGEVWCCKNCKTETVAGDKPNEENY